jgi:hypothetical protein
LTFQVNQDPLDGIVGRERPGEGERRRGDVFVEATAGEHLPDDGRADATGDEIAVECVHKGVGLGVVAKEALFRLADEGPLGAAPRDPGDARLKERRELVTELVAEGPKAKPE